MDKGTSQGLFILLMVILPHFSTVQFLKYCLILELVERNFHIFVADREVKMKGEIYKIGDEVVHDVFGDGVIVDKIYNRYTKKPIIVVKFNSLDTNRNIVASFYGIRRKK